MIRGARTAALLTALAVAVPEAVTPGAGSPARGSPWCLVVTDRQSGAAVGSMPLEPAGEFALTYRHSYYDEPATERMRVDAAGSIVVDRIESPSLAVLDYYELTGAVARRNAAGWIIDAPADVARPDLSVLASATGRRTLVVGAATLPLWRSDGETRAVRLSAEPHDATGCR